MWVAAASYLAANDVGNYLTFYYLTILFVISAKISRCFLSHTQTHTQILCVLGVVVCECMCVFKFACLVIYLIYFNTLRKK